MQKYIQNLFMCALDYVFVNCSACICESHSFVNPSFCNNMFCLHLRAFLCAFATIETDQALTALPDLNLWAVTCLPLALANDTDQRPPLHNHQQHLVLDGELLQESTVQPEFGSLCKSLPDRRDESQNKEGMSESENILTFCTVCIRSVNRYVVTRVLSLSTATREGDQYPSWDKGI